MLGGVVSRDHIAFLALIVVSAAAFLGLRQSGTPEPHAPAARASVRPSDAAVQVKDLALDESNDRRSIRVLHPSEEVQRYLHDWLEPRERAAVDAKASFVCSAETASATLVSVRCVSVAPATPGSPEPEPEYVAMTLRIDGDSFEELDLHGVLAPGVGERAVVEACNRFANPPDPCGWPPSAFAIVGGRSLFVCHAHRCVDIEEEEGAPPLLRRGVVTSASRW
jgi:hypothetical protein